MRVIAGKYGGRRLHGPGKLNLRPTSDQLRETLFNILGPSIEDSLFVDAYAGTGAIGIEAGSRGAKEVYFLEKNPSAIKLVERNLEELGIDSGVEVIGGDVERGLRRLVSRHLLADFIFLDPPYDQNGEYERALEFLDDAHLIAPSGMVIVEHFKKVELPDRFDRLELARVKEQGDAVLSFYTLALAA